MEYKVKNLANDVRQFRDRWFGGNVLVKPNETVITRKPPKPSDIWDVQINTEKTEEKKVKKEVSRKMETKKHRKLRSE